MKRLTEIGIKNNTDKATFHMFTEMYDDVFSKFTSPRILEIGVFNFGSIQTYIDYFENPYIVAMDIKDKSDYLNDKWKFIQGDQTKINDLSKCVEGEELFDIVIDDGGHTMKQQQITFGYLIDYVKPGGYYILEDLHTSFRVEFIERGCKFNSYQMLQLIQEGKSPFSNYIEEEQQLKIIDKIESIEIWSKTESLYDSVTSVIKLK
jgi:hypothetical protein